MWTDVVQHSHYESVISNILQTEGVGTSQLSQIMGKCFDITFTLNLYATT